MVNNKLLNGRNKRHYSECFLNILHLTQRPDVWTVHINTLQRKYNGGNFS